MPETCCKCNGEIANVKEDAVCADCAEHFHPSCTRLKTVDSFKKLSAKVKKKWRCDNCYLESSSNATNKSDPDAEESTLIEVINKLREDMTVKLDQNFSKLSSVDVTVQSLKVEFDEIKAEISQLKQNYKVIDEDVNRLKQANVETKSEVAGLRSRICDLEQYSRVNNLLITGVPATSHEDIMAILENIAHVLGIEFIRGDISVAHRLRAKRGSRSPPIVVQFVARVKKNAWIAARRAKKSLSTAELTGRHGDETIFFSDHLTPYNSELFYRARQLVKDGTILQAWTRDGKVFIRREQNSGATRVIQLNDLH